MGCGLFVVTSESIAPKTRVAIPPKAVPPTVPTYF